MDNDVWLAILSTFCMVVMGDASIQRPRISSEQKQKKCVCRCPSRDYVNKKCRLCGGEL